VREAWVYFGADKTPSSLRFPALSTNIKRVVKTRVLPVFTAVDRYFHGLVCNLLLRGGRGLLPECELSEEYLGHNLAEHCLEDTRVV